ncbi:MAG: hypothetical protein LBU34_10385 [Planctomycetaceae bacterium]|nr:hypothetical protein [Planctomycetaceae bacterium]
MLAECQQTDRRYQFSHLPNQVENKVSADLMISNSQGRQPFAEGFSPTVAM